jgi:SNF2 family DNA or RNA helicase
MGLGKTVQAIEAARLLFREEHCHRLLIVCPRSLVFNWISEIQKWAPELAVTPMMPIGLHAGATWQQRARRAHVLVTSYEQLRLHASDIANFFDLIIADEAHKLRNSSSAVSRSMRLMNAQTIWFLTGTPVERDSADFITLLSLLEPGRFSKRDLHLSNSAIRFRAKDLLLRRRKSEVLSDLPEMTVTRNVIELSPPQSRAYERLKADVKFNPGLSTFGKLRQICDLESETKSSSKLDRALEIIEEIQSIDESVVVFSFWNSALESLKTRLEKEFNISPLYLSSQLSLVDRQQMVQEFQNEGGVLLASGHIAAEGLTLTRANHAIFLNQWWNPSTNRQAEDRIRRIGQNKPTFVYTFTCKNTIEEAFVEMHDRKNLTEEELIGLLTRNL